MNKKIKLTFLTILTAISATTITSCKKSSYSGKVFLDYGYISKDPLSSITSLTELRYNSLKSLVNDSKESFMLVIYDNSCSCWSDFQPVITKYINECRVKVQYISVNEFLDEDDDFGLYLEKMGMPSVALFERGKLAKQEYLRGDTSEPSYLMFKNYEYFKKWADENVVLPKMFYIEKDVLDSYIAEDREFDLYIARSKCHDCQAVNRDVLSDFSDDHSEFVKPLYIFDLQKYQDEDPDNYSFLKKKYGLTTDYNPTLGYDLFGGCVPTFQHRVGNEITNMITVLNDYYEDTTIHSYFTSEHVNNNPFLKDADLTKVLEGKEITSEQASDWSVYKATFYREYHYPIVELFLNTFLL